jgi:ankyrin repeat protein
MPTRLNPIFDAVLEGDAAVARLLRGDREFAQARATRDQLVESIPHTIYVGDTPLHLAAAGLKVEVARRLIDAGADVNAINRRGATPLHYACDPRPRGSHVWNPMRQREMIELLVTHSAEIDRADRGGVTPLHRAVRSRGVAAVRELLVRGARTDIRSTRGASPLQLAAHSSGAGGTKDTAAEQREIIAALLEHGANRDAPGVRG